MSLDLNSSKQRSFEVIALALLCGLICLSRCYTFREPADWDIGTYAVIGHELDHGQSLYSDIWDVKPPGVYLSYALAERVMGYGLGEVYLLSVVTACATMIGIWYAASTYGRFAGLFAAAIFAIVSGDLYLQGNRANTEAFINLFLVWGSAFLLRLDADSRPFSVVSIGILLATASLYKQVAIAPIGAILIAHFVAPPRGVTRKRALVQLFAITVTIMIAWGAVFAYFAMAHRGNLFWLTTIVYPRFYGGNVVLNLISSMEPKHLFPRSLYGLLPCALLTIVALAWPPQPETRSRAMLLAMMVGAQLDIGMLQQFFDHYYQFWFIPLCIGAGWGAAAMPARLKSRRLAISAIAVALIAAVWIQFPYYRLPLSQWDYLKNGLFHSQRQFVGRELGDLLSPEEKFFDWSENNAWLYFVAQRRPVGPGLWRGHMIEGPMAQVLTELTLQRLKNSPPRIVVVWSANKLDEDHPITRWIAANYEEIDDGVTRWPLVLMRWKGSRFAASGGTDFR